jgi:hypothetical protein
MKELRNGSSSVSIESDYRLDDWGSIPGRGKASVFRPALRTTQPPIQCVPVGVLSPGVKPGRGVTLITHPRLVPRSIMSRGYISFPPWRLHGVAVQLYFTLYERIRRCFRRVLWVLHL